MTLHIVSQSSQDSCTDLAARKLCRPGDIIADLTQAFPTISIVDPTGSCQEITLEVLASTDFWSLAREWLVAFTKNTNLQDLLSIDGYGFWWTMNSLKFAPAWSNMANTFTWIKALSIINQSYRVHSVQIHGSDRLLKHIAAQIFRSGTIEGDNLQVRPKEASQSPRKRGLLLVRLVMGLVTLVVSLFRRPQICIYSSTNLLRTVTKNSQRRLEDIYMGPAEKALRRRGWRTILVEKHGWNASWLGIKARGFFFPNDILFLLSAPQWFRLGLYRSTVEKWRHKWATERDQITRQLFFEGVDLGPIYLGLLEEQFTRYGPSLEIMTGMWRRILRRWSPRLLLINDSYGSSAVPVIIAAKTLGIRTVEQQHGVIGRNHNAYLVPREIETQSRFPLCDMMLAWGAHTKRLLMEFQVYQPFQIAVCGFPRIDELLSDLAPRAATLEALQVPVDAKVVLYTSNMVAADLMPAILDSVASTAAAQEIYWLIKLHPREKTRTRWESEIARRDLQKIRILEGEMDFYALLEACDVHVSFVSTTLIEAAILGKINLGLDISGISDAVGYRGAGAYLPVAPDRLAPAVIGILENDVQRASLLRQQGAFAEDWCLHDGRALERIVAHLESLIQPSEA